METAEEFIARQDRKWAAHRGIPFRMKDIGRQGFHWWAREAWTFLVQSNLPEKVLVVEQLRHTHRSGQRAETGGAEVGDIEYRFGYYIVGRVGRATGRWVWGQFSPMIMAADLAKLLQKAIDDGTISQDVAQAIRG